MRAMLSFCEASPSGFIFSFLNSSFSLSMPPATFLWSILVLSPQHISMKVNCLCIYMQPRMDHIYTYIASAFPNHLKADHAYSLLICFVFYIWFLNQYLPYSPVSTTFYPTLRNGKKEKKKTRVTTILQVAWLSFSFFFPISDLQKGEAWIFSENLWKLLSQVCDKDHWKHGGKCSCSYLEADSFEAISGWTI